MVIYLTDGTEAHTPLEPLELYELFKLNKAGSARVFVRIQRAKDSEHGAAFKAIVYIDCDRSLKDIIIGNHDTYPPDEPIPYVVTELPETD